MVDLTETELSELEELEELEKAATAGPWAVEYDNDTGPYRYWFEVGPAKVEGYSSEDREQFEREATFIAAMRNALPSLLAAARERDELRRQVEAIREIIENPPRSLLISVGVLREAIAATESKGEL